MVKKDYCVILRFSHAKNKQTSQQGSKQINKPKTQKGVVEDSSSYYYFIRKYVPAEDEYVLLLLF